MSAWTEKRKTLYIAGLLIFFIALGVGIYVRYFTPKPTCFDQKKNGDEYGVDCGGSCVLLCPVQVRNVVILWSRAFQVVGDVYNLVVYIENPNVQAGVHTLTYRFRVYDKDNILIGERYGSTFVGPAEKSAIVEPTFKAGERIPTRVFFDILGTPQWIKMDPRLTEQRLFISEQRIENRDTAPRLLARARSEFESAIPDVTFVAILYNQTGNAIAASTTFFDRIAPLSSTELTFTWPRPFAGDITRIEILPRIDIRSFKTL